jgi:lipopolysaccharide export system permease protein
MAPLYPFAFMVIAYAFLGAPRTTRQSRGWSMLAVIGCVAGLRLIGFASTVFGVHAPFVLFLPYAAVLATFGLGGFAISRGLIIEPPAFLVRIGDMVTEYVARRTGPLLGTQQ